MVMLYGLAIKNPPAMWETQGDPCSIPGSGRSPGGGQGNPVQYSCLENPMDGGAWQATYSPWGCKESDMTARLTLHYIIIVKLELAAVETENPESKLLNYSLLNVQQP